MNRAYPFPIPSLIEPRSHLWVALIALGGLACPASPKAPPSARTSLAMYTPNPIEAENALSGSAGWQLTGPIAQDAQGQIQGYASDVSVNRGATIDFHITVNPPQTYDIEIYRMGWYSGSGGRLMQTVGPLSGVSQPACPSIPGGNNSVQCSWSVAHTLTVPSGWTSGIYLTKLTNAAGYQSYIMFVVRDDARDADLLYQQATLTYQAYNNYPAHLPTAWSFYYPGSSSSNPFVGRQLSFDRPYTSVTFSRNNVGDGAGGFFTWDFPMIRWLEMNGYDVVYAANTDLHRDPGRLFNVNGILSVGHDEYWSQAMYDAVTLAKDAGVGLAFFSGNMVFRTVALEPTGNPGRIMQSLTQSGAPTLSYDYDHEKRQLLTGLAVTGCCVRQPTKYQNLNYVVSNSGHFVFEDTGFQNGNAVPGLLGYEPDAYRPQYALPPHRVFDFLSSSPFQSGGNVVVNPWPLSEAQSVMYQAPSRAWVFTAGLTDWPWGLDNSNGGVVADARIQITTENALRRLTGGPKAEGPYCYRASETDGHPESQGWTNQATVDGRGRLVMDAGEPAWQAYGVGGKADWSAVPTAAQHALADQNGWRLSARMRIMSGHYNAFYYADGGWRYLVILRLDANGNLIATLEGGATHTLVTGTGGAQYHDYAITYDPASGQATFTFDGVPVQTWGGSSTNQNWVMFGNSATGIDGISRYRNVSFEIFGSGTLFSYDATAGARTPESQGWSPFLSVNGSGQPVMDQGSWAWQANGTGGRAIWQRIPTALDHADGALGWTMTAEMRVLSGDYTTSYYANGSRRSLPIVRIDPNGDLVARLEGGLTHVLVSGSGAAAYHTYEVNYVPQTGKSTFTFDGTLVDTWAGSTTGQNVFAWGNGATAIDGVANYRSVCFTLDP